MIRVAATLLSVFLTLNVWADSESDYRALLSEMREIKIRTEGLEDGAHREIRDLYLRSYQFLDALEADGTVEQDRKLEMGRTIVTYLGRLFAETTQHYVDANRAPPVRRAYGENAVFYNFRRVARFLGLQAAAVVREVKSLFTTALPIVGPDARRSWMAKNVVADLGTELDREIERMEARGIGDDTLKKQVLLSLLGELQTAEPARFGRRNRVVFWSYIVAIGFVFIHPLELTFVRTTASPFISFLVEAAVLGWMARTRVVNSGLTFYRRLQKLLKKHECASLLGRAAERSVPEVRVFDWDANRF